MLEARPQRVEEVPMRLLRLDLGPGHSIDLHPFVTLLTELGDNECDEVLKAVRTLGAGSTAGVRGLIQHRGLLVELDGSVPPHVLAATRAEVAIDGQSLSGADLNWLRDRIDLQGRRAEIAAVRVEEVRADLRLSARAELQNVERRLSTVASDGTDGTDARRRLEEALAAVLATEPELISAPDGVVELLALLAEHEADMREEAAHLRRLEHVTERARERIIMARKDVEQAEIEARPALLTREQEARLEHLAFPYMDETRKGRWRKHLRPEEKAEMAELLAVVGVDNWTAYTVYRTAPPVPADKQAALADAQAALAEAEQHWTEMQARYEQDPVRLEFKKAEEGLRDRARAFLGMMLPNDLSSALSQLTVHEPNPDWEPVVERLARALDAVGASVADRHDGPALIDAAQAVLADSGEESTADEQLMAEHERARATLESHQRAMARLEAAEAAATQATLGLARLEEQLMACGHSDATGVDAVLAMIEPIATQVALEDNGSLPVVLHGDLPVSADDEVERLMNRLSELSADLQIIVVSSRSAVRAWAANVGLDRAMVSGSKPTAGAENTAETTAAVDALTL